MLKLNTKYQLRNFAGKPLADNETGATIVLGTLLANILGGKTSNPTLSWVLGKKFATEEFVDLKAEEVVFVKDEVLKLGTLPAQQGGWLTGLLCGQIMSILDEGTPVEVEEKVLPTTDEVKVSKSETKRKAISKGK